MLPKIRAELQAKAAAARLPAATEWRFSYDNAKPHNKAQQALPPGSRLDLPALSPDMHKVVEHVHPRMAAEMLRWLRQRGGKAEVAECEQELRAVFARVATADAVDRDVASLPGTYQAIIAAGGEFPAKSFR